MKQPSVAEYKKAIRNNALTARQLETLQILHGFPNHTASLFELGQALIPNSTATVIASGQIGRVGKALAEGIGLVPPEYNNGRSMSPAYFLMVAKYYQDPGYVMNKSLAKALLDLKLVEEKSADTTFRLPNEMLPFEEEQFFKEGKVIQVFVTKTERSVKARTACIKHHGTTCINCRFNFGETYGKFAQDFIHVHHTTPLSKTSGEYVLNALEDLVPLCANCHAVIHMRKEPLTLKELKRITKKEYSIPYVSPFSLETTYALPAAVSF